MKIVLDFSEADSFWSLKLSDVVQIVLALSTLALALVVWHWQRRSERTQIEHSLREGWLDVDLMVAASEKDQLAEFDKLCHSFQCVEQVTESARRKRWISYAMLNLILSRYHAADQKVVANHQQIKEACMQFLEKLACDPRVREVMSSDTFEQSVQVIFQEAIKRAREKGMLRDEPPACCPLGEI